MPDGILDKISKMVNIKSSIEAGQQREEASQRDSMKFILDQQRASNKAELDNMKYMTNKYTDLYFKAKGNTALQENILSTMQGMKQSMPPAFRQQFDVFTKAGPFSEVAEKQRKFQELYGSIPRPLTEEENKDPMLKGKHAFATIDYNQKKENFITGKASGKKRRFISTGDGIVVGRTEDGFFYQTSEEALNIQAIAKDYGVNAGKLFADDGLVFGTPTKGQFNGRGMTATPYKDAIGNRADGVSIDYGEQRSSGGKPEWQTPALRSLLVNFMSESEGGSEGALWARNIKEAIKDSDIIPMTKKEMASGITDKKRKSEIRELNSIITARMNLIPDFKNINFKVYDPDFDRYDLLSAWGVSRKATLVAIPGTPQRVFTADGKSTTLYNSQGEAYDGSGQHLGAWEEIEQMFNATTKADLLKK